MEHTVIENAELPLEGVGPRLRRAREMAGLSRADIAARTRIADRHLVSIEEGQFAALASRTYAIGFSRSYARAVGLNESEVTRAVNEELDLAGSRSIRNAKATFEPGDPTRVPSARTAWVAALGAVLVVLAGFFFWRSFYSPAVSLPPLLPDKEAAAAPQAQAAQNPAAAPQAQGPVVFTAREDGVWVRFYDAAGNQLLQKVMAQGESYSVPADANGPMIRTARPDALAITVGGKPVPVLSDKQQIVSDVPVTAAALLARQTSPAATAPAAPGGQGTHDRPQSAPMASAQTAPQMRPVASGPAPEAGQPSTVPE